MKWPPYLLKLRFLNPDHTFKLWLPLFLIWPLVLVFLLAALVILLPFALLALVFTLRTDWLLTWLKSMPAIYKLLSELPGLKVDLNGDQGQVYIEFV
jgi:hypothetical protein